MKSKHDTSICSSNHEDKDINFVGQIKFNILSSLSVEKLNIKPTETHRAIHIINKQTKNGKINNDLWMLFYKRLFRDITDKDNNNLTQVNELLFRINYVINQDNSKLFGYSIVPFFNPIDTYNNLLSIVEERKVTKSTIGPSSPQPTLKISSRTKAFSPIIKPKERKSVLVIGKKSSSLEKKAKMILSNYYLKRYDVKKMKILQNEDITNNFNQNKLIYKYKYNEYKDIFTMKKKGVGLIDKVEFKKSEGGTVDFTYLENTIEFANDIAKFLIN